MKNIFAAALFGAATATNLMETKFIEYLAHHNKSYGTQAEFEFRLAQFARTELEIAVHNSAPHTSTVGHNKFSDWSLEEKSRLRGIPKVEPELNAVYASLDTEDLPDYVNWVEFGATNDV